VSESRWNTCLKMTLQQASGAGSMNSNAQLASISFAGPPSRSLPISLDPEEAEARGVDGRHAILSREGI